MNDFEKGKYIYIDVNYKMSSKYFPVHIVKQDGVSLKTPHPKGWVCAEGGHPYITYAEKSHIFTPSSF